MARERRQPSIATTVSFGHRTVAVAAGLKPSGRDGGELQTLADDAGVLLSRLLQYGDRLDDIARGLGRAASGPASFIGAAVDALVQLERDLAQGGGA